MLGRLKSWARDVTRDVMALAWAMRDSRVPWPAKALAAVVVAYAFSPIDLIPDFIPVLGYLDDLVLLPLGVLLVVRLIPPAVMRDHRARAMARLGAPAPAGRRWAAAVIVAVWLAVAGWVAMALAA